MQPQRPLLSNMQYRGFPILLALVLMRPGISQAGSYEQSKSIQDALLSSATYNPTQRPLRDQDDILSVDAFFGLVSIVEINDVVQSFKCNGFLVLMWRDEVRLEFSLRERYDYYSIVRPHCVQGYRYVFAKLCVRNFLLHQRSSSFHMILC